MSSPDSSLLVYFHGAAGLYNADKVQLSRFPVLFECSCATAESPGLILSISVLDYGGQAYVEVSGDRLPVATLLGTFLTNVSERLCVILDCWSAHPLKQRDVHGRQSLGLRDGTLQPDDLLQALHGHISHVGPSVRPRLLSSMGF